MLKHQRIWKVGESSDLEQTLNTVNLVIKRSVVAVSSIISMGSKEGSQTYVV